MLKLGCVALVISGALLVAHVASEAGPGEEEDGAPKLELDEAYKAHVGELLSFISESEGKANVKYSDLKPQMVDVHTIAPRIPAMRVGMNAKGHNMLHVHSDEAGKWSSEILSSGATAGFSFTDRKKGSQKGAKGKLGSQWTMYSLGQTFRLKDHGSGGDVLQVKDSTMTLKGIKGKSASKPRFTVESLAKDSVPRITLVSKKGGSSKHISLYNRYGKFGVFSGALDKSIMHLSADGSELALTTTNKQPHITIESKADGASAQEVILKGKGHSTKLFHKAGTLGFCGIAKGSKKCKTFFQSTTKGEVVDIISQAEKATFKISHRIKGGPTELHLISQDKVGGPTTANIYNSEGTLGIAFKSKKAKKTLLTISPKGEAKVHGKLEVDDVSVFSKDAKFKGNVNVDGVVTMQGKTMTSMMSEMEETKRENMLLRRRMEDMEQDTKDMQTRMTEMEGMMRADRERVESMMSTLQLMQQTTEMA